VATLIFDCDLFWRQKKGLLGKAVRGRQLRPCDRAEPEDVMGYVYLTLRRRRPEGRVEGANPESFINTTLVAEARKCIRDEVSPRRRIARAALLPIEAAGERGPARQDSAFHGAIAGEVSGDIRSALDQLPPSDRELIQMRFGIDRPPSTLAEIATVRGLTFQAIAKRVDRILRRLRPMLRHHAL